MVNMSTTDFDEMKRRNLVLDGIYHPPDSGEGEKETH
jgi:hypothetical protein